MPISENLAPRKYPAIRYVFELMKKVLFCMHVCLIVADQHVNVEGYSIADAVPMKGGQEIM